jgi:hypothetical protein
VSTSGSSNAQQNEPFVSGDDRPAVQLNPDMPVSELRVRDLSSLLGGQAAKKLETAKELKPELKEKFEIIKEKPEKFEHKEKPEKFEHKEKPEKHEHKEKPEKIEHKEKPEKFEHKELLKEVVKDFKEAGKELENKDSGSEGPQRPQGPEGGDPRIDQLIETVSQLQRDVNDMKTGGG